MVPEVLRDALSAVLMLTGVALAVIAALGLVRFPDVFSRMHAATKPATLGVLLITVGAALRMEQPDDAVPRFQYEEHIRTILEDRAWPNATRAVPPGVAKALCYCSSGDHD